MATSKAKRPILLAQPKPQHAKAARRSPRPLRRSKNHQPKSRAKQNSYPDTTGALPVKAHIYRAIAEMNTGFAKVIQEFGTLAQVRFFNSERITAMREQICRVRAQANRDFTVVMHVREKLNAWLFELDESERKKQARR